jgi:hypothetical protein
MPNTNLLRLLIVRSRDIARFNERAGTLIELVYPFACVGLEDCEFFVSDG